MHTKEELEKRNKGEEHNILGCVTRCSLVEVYRNIASICSIGKQAKHATSKHSSEDGGRTFLRSFGKHL